MTKMNENARAWVKALRSGKYQHSTGQLRSERGFCCLGVACEISGLGEWNKDRISYYQPNDFTEGCAVTLPIAVQEWLGMKTSNGSVEIGSEQHTSLIALNDNGKSFNEIADLIEKYQDKLFIRSAPS